MVVSSDRATRWKALDDDVRVHVDLEMGDLWPGSPLVFEATSPEALRDGRLERAVHAGLTVWLTDEVLEGSGPLSLRVLEPVLEDLPALHIESTAPVTDFEVLKWAESLASLHLKLRRAPVTTDLSSLPALRDLAGSGRDLAKLFPLGGGSLDVLSFLSPHVGSELIVEFRVRQLVLVDLGRSIKTVDIQSPLELRSLTLKGADTFTLDTVSECCNLEELDLSQSELLGLAVIPKLEKLKRLFIAMCGTREPWTALLGAKAPLISLESLGGLSPETFQEFDARGWFEPHVRWE